MKTILITGADGFIGRNLHKFLQRNYKVTVLTRNHCNFSDRDQVKKVFEGKYYDIIIHTAIQGGGRLASCTHEMFYNNICMTLNLLQQKSHYGVFINIGSGLQYQDRYKLDNYVLSKIISSEYVQQSDSFINLIVFHCFGNSEPDSKFISFCINKFYSEQDIEIFNERAYDFFSIYDFCSVVEYLILSGITNKRFDMCYKEKFTLSETAHKVNNIMQAHCDIKVKTRDSVQYCGEYCALFDNITLLGFQGSLKQMISQKVVKSD